MNYDRILQEICLSVGDSYSGATLFECVNLFL